MGIHAGPTARRHGRRLEALLLAVAMLAACATAKPVLYANEKYRQVGTEVAARDVAECEKLANQAGAPSEGRRGRGRRAIAGSPGTGAAAGPASGAVWGLFSWMFGWMSPSRRAPRTWATSTCASRSVDTRSPARSERPDTGLLQIARSARHHLATAP